MTHLQQRPLILVIGDQAEVLDDVIAALNGANFSCRCCRTAEEAVAAAVSSPPDLIVSDIHLHGHSALEVCERIRHDAALTEVPVMLLCGAQVPDVIRRSGSRGGTYYLRKPCDPEVLVGLIDTALGSPQLAAGHAGPP